MMHYVSIDIETTYIREITKDIEKVWLIGWYYRDLQVGTMEYDYLAWDDGIALDELANHVHNCDSLSAISTGTDKEYYTKLNFLRGVLAGDDFYRPVFHSAQFDKNKVLERAGFVVKQWDDTMLAVYIMIPPSAMGSTGDGDSTRYYSLGELGKRGFCSAKLEKPDFSGWSKEMIEYNKQDCIATYDLACAFLPAIESNDMSRKAYKLDLMTQDVTASMEAIGTYIDQVALQNLANLTSDETEQTLEAILEQCPAVCPPGGIKKRKTEADSWDVVTPKNIYPKEEIGKLVYDGRKPDTNEFLYREVKQFNPSSTPHKVIALKQLTGWVPTKFSRKTNNPVCDKYVLKELSELYTFAGQLLNYQEFDKLRSTYIPAFSKTDMLGRVHPSFPITATRTSRLSSRSPNFQNIPKDRCRSIIAAPKGKLIINVDLSQIELRVLAYYAAVVLNDFYLWGLYAKGADVHNSNMKLLETDNRRIAKVGIFLKIYGGGASKLAAACGLSLAEAEDKLKLMNERMPFLDELKAKMVYAAKHVKKNTLFTLYGHRIYYPDILSDDRAKRARAERQLFNASIQGTAADVFKILMCELYHKSNLSHLGCHLILNVHDELLFECPERNAPIAMDIIDNTFYTDKILPGLPVEGVSGCGQTWEAAKEHSDERYEVWHKGVYGELDNG